MSTDNTKTPWKNGFYYSDKNTAELKKFNGNTAEIYSIVNLDYPDMGPVGQPGTITYGDFGPAREEVQKASGGVKNYNVEISLLGGIKITKGIVSTDGKVIYSWGFWNTLEYIKWMSDEDLKKLADDRDPWEAPSCPYKIQPENQGKLVWLSGPPGAGKSTTGQLMSREAGFVYLEADCMMNNINPFVPPDVDNPTLAGFQQKALKGIPRDHIDQMRITHNEFKKLAHVKGNEIDWEKTKPFYSNVSRDIDVQRKRIGGNFVIAQAVTSQNMRDHIRLTLPDCTFITLTLTEENQLKRVRERHGEDCGKIVEKMNEFAKFYEGPGEGEKNTYNVDITENMAPKDVMNKVLEILDNIDGGTKTPWKNGFYYSSKATHMLQKFEGNTAEAYSHMFLDYPDLDPMAPPGTITYGDFGPAHEKIQKASGGIKNYNVQIVMFHGILTSNGVVSNDGKTIYSWGIANDVECHEWMSDEDLKKLADDREHKDSPSCPYKIQPENQGKLVWFSGPPGAGKSTTGQLMSKKAGFVYLEADCISQFLNPFIPSNVDNPSMAGFQQKALKGVSRDYVDTVVTTMSEFQKLSQGRMEEIDWNKTKPFYTNMAKDIETQRKRIGGDFAIAQAVTSRDMRDHIKLTLKDCIFITLTLTKETQRKRIIARHGDNEGAMEFLGNIYQFYEGPGDDEKNVYNINITENMTPDDVMNKALEILDNISNK